MKFNINRIFDLSKLTKELSNGLTKLNFTDNFESQTEEVVISATSTADIPNTLNFIPSSFIILMQEGNGLLTKEQDWTSSNLYIYNNGAVTVTAKIIFFK